MQISIDLRIFLSLCHVYMHSGNLAHINFFSRVLSLILRNDNCAERRADKKNMNGRLYKYYMNNIEGELTYKNKTTSNLSLLQVIPFLMNESNTVRNLD
uniref:Uncharacterized protein n=1 Tax=Arion vulgaris TaxID=1028688 RepID=A0A0B7A9D8_9EUPU